MKIRCTLETDMKKLFESKKQVAAIGTPDAQIVMLKAPFIQHEQLLLAKNFRQYLKTILFSTKVLRWGFKKPRIRKCTNCKPVCKISR